MHWNSITGQNSVFASHELQPSDPTSSQINVLTMPRRQLVHSVVRKSLVYWVLLTSAKNRFPSAGGRRQTLCWTVGRVQNFRLPAQLQSCLWFKIWSKTQLKIGNSIVKEQIRLFSWSITCFYGTRIFITAFTIAHYLVVSRTSSVLFTFSQAKYLNIIPHLRLDTQNISF